MEVFSRFGNKGVDDFDKGNFRGVVRVEINWECFESEWGKIENIE